MPTVSGSPTTGHPGVMMPSEMHNTENPATGAGANAHVDDTVPQQGATEPGSGSTVHEEGNVPFKDAMIGYAKSIRGTVLHKPETKATGDKILSGEMTGKEYFDQKKAAKEKKE